MGSEEGGRSSAIVTSWLAEKDASERSNESSQRFSQKSPVDTFDLFKIKSNEKKKNLFLTKNENSLNIIKANSFLGGVEPPWIQSLIRLCQWEC